jgi:hypothetical protein
MGFPWDFYGNDVGFLMGIYIYINVYNYIYIYYIYIYIYIYKWDNI